MERYLTAVIALTICATVLCCDVVKMTFPSGFRIGVGSASYQVEGAWNVSDKGVNIWDFWTHKYPELVTDGTNGDIACDSYHKYQEDVQIIKSIGLDFYRFSVSWSRVLPTGFTNVISEDGIQYYKNLTAELVANGIEPIVTIYHWDHPQVIEEMGGWMNELIVDWFVDYSRILFDALGHNVKRWITINEPESFCYNGYESILIAPGKLVPGIGGYLCIHNMLKAHAKTYRMYEKEFRDTQQGLISFAPHVKAYLAANSTDTQSAETMFQFNVGWIAHPLYFGDYPEIMKTRIAMVSKYQGYPRSRLPIFSDEWIAIIKNDCDASKILLGKVLYRRKEGLWPNQSGTNDYFGVNQYTSRVVYPDPAEELGIYTIDSGLIETVDPSWPASVAPGFYTHPPGFGQVLRKIRDEYNNPPVWVMENGFGDIGELEDYDRISYFYEYLKELLIAIKRDGCNVEGYAIWTILDNYQWCYGYTNRFGIVSVDFDDPDRTRNEKLSAKWWRNVLSKRKLQSVPTNSNVTRTRLYWQK